jgi:hypothetical protein
MLPPAKKGMKQFWYDAPKSAIIKPKGCRSNIMPKFSALFLILASYGVASCAPAIERAPIALTEKQSAELARALKDKTAGKPVNCISNSRNSNTIRISDNILLYRVSGNLVYQNNLRYSCPGLARGNEIMVSEIYGDNLCKGDTFSLADRYNGINGPTCSLGEFIPFKKNAG